MSTVATPPARGRLLGGLLRATPRARAALSLAVVLAACASGATIGLLGTSGWLIARAAEMPPIMYLNVAIVGVRFFGLSRSVFRYAERLVGHQLALRMQSALRLQTYDRLSRTTLLGRSRGDLLARVVADVDAILDLTVRVVLPFAAGAVASAGTALILTRFSPANAAVLLLTAVLAGGVIPWFCARLSRRADQDAAPARGRLAAQAEELHRTAVDLVAYDADGPARAALLRTDAELTAIEKRSAWVRGLATFLQTLSAALAVIAALVLGGQAAHAGVLQPRMVAVLALVPLSLHEVIADLAQAAQTRTRAQTALGRVDELLHTPLVGTGDAPQEAAAGTPRLAVADLAVGWPDGPALIEGLSFAVEPGHRLAITGRSGIGKTTIAATLLGSIAPKAGTVSIDGRVGYLAQDAYIFATSVAENVRIGNRDATDAEIRAALDRVGLDRIDPNRIVGEGGQSLSGGEERRVALARLLVGRYDVWILDEPTEHLDAETAEALMRDIWAQSARCPLLVFTHDPEVVDACDSQLILAPAGTA